MVIPALQISSILFDGILVSFNRIVRIQSKNYDFFPCLLSVSNEESSQNFACRLLRYCVTSRRPAIITDSFELLVHCN